MAEEKSTKLEREYTIPLRKQLLKVPLYRRSGRAVKTIKQFLAKHMKVPDRDVSKVKMDMSFNQEIWFRGRTNPPTKVKVKAVKEGDIVRVELAELSEVAKFAKAKHEKRHAPAEKKKVSEKTDENVKKEEVGVGSTDKEASKKENEQEKEKATEIQHTKQAEAQIKTQKHTSLDKTISKGKSHRPFRQALKK